MNIVKYCAIPCCSNNSVHNSNLNFYCLPRITGVRQEWLKVLGKKAASLPQPVIKVCENHFRPKDFVSGQRKLKLHAVPLLNLGYWVPDPVDSDEEIMQEEVTSRRPTRRAAQEAAKKIHNSAKKIVEEDNEPEYVPNSPRQGNIQRLRQALPKLTAKINFHPSMDIGLLMECNEEILSEVQAEAMLKAQLEYNQVMKKLRALKAENVRIIEVDSAEFALQQLQRMQSAKPNVAYMTYKNPQTNVVPMQLSTTQMVS